MQSGQGIQAGGNGRHITDDSMDISFCMGDGTTCGGGSSVQVKNGYDTNWQVADLDGNALVIASITHCTSDYISALPDTDYYILGSGKQCLLHAPNYQIGNDSGGSFENPR